MYIAGGFHDKIDFDQDRIFDIVTTPPDTAGLFLAHYTPEGTLKWVRSFGSNAEGLVDLQYAPLTNTLYAFTLEGIFELSENGFVTGVQYGEIVLYVFDIEGNTLHKQSIYSNTASEEGILLPAQFLIDPSNNIYLSGSFNGMVDFDGDGPAAPLSSDGFNSVFLAKYSLFGSLLWARHGTGYINRLQGLHVDQEQGIWISGHYNQHFELITPDTTHIAPDIPVDFPFDRRPHAYFARFLPDGRINCSSFVPNQTEGIRFTPFGGGIIEPTPGSVLVGNSWQGNMDFDSDGQNDLSSPDSLYTVYVNLNYDCTTQWSWVSEPDIGLLRLYEGHGQYHMDGYFDGGQLFLDGLEDEPALVADSSAGYTFFSARFENFDGVLPVELTHFSLLLDGTSITLNWETASELNNAGFDVLHRHPEADWKKLGFVQGSGTTNQHQQYAYRAELLSPGTHHFRLKQIDFDGTFEYSEERVIDIGLDQEYVLSNAYPNPFNPQTTFSLSVVRAQDVTIELYDMTGRRIQTLFQGPLSANSSHQFTIDGSQLSSGIYLYRASGDHFTSSKPITLIK